MVGVCLRDLAWELQCQKVSTDWNQLYLGYRRPADSAIPAGLPNPHLQTNLFRSEQWPLWRFHSSPEVIWRKGRKKNGRIDATRIDSAETVGLEAKKFVAEIVRWRRLCVAESTKKAVTTSLGNDELRKFAGRRMDPVG